MGNEERDNQGTVPEGKPEENSAGSISVGNISDVEAVAIGHGAHAEVHHHYPPPPQPKFVVPFPHNEHFVGRDDDLQRLHAALQKGETVGVRPAMLTGMGGIGKTQLAVEYAYRYQSDYPGGVYWVNAAQDWQDELASLAIRVGLRKDDVPESERRLRLVLAFADFLNDHPNTLIIFDNVEDPRLLRTPAPGFVPTELNCSLLFTTRRRVPDLPFESIEVRVLPEMAALELLLSTEARRELLLRLRNENIDPEIDAARTICRSLGYLPLALALAAAYLGKYPRISLAGYLRRLEKEGGLETVDASGADPLDLPTRHDAAVRATLKSQWDVLENEDARLVLQAAALLGEAVQIPRARLVLLIGLSDESTEGFPTPLEQALVVLHDLWLVEDLTEQEIRLHPLVGQFAVGTIPAPKSYAYACLTRMANSLGNFARLNQEVAKRGIDPVLDDLRSGIDVAVQHRTIGIGAEVTDRLIRLSHVLNLEVHHLRQWDAAQQPSFFLQQFANRCLELGLNDLWERATTQLSGWRLPYLRERFRLGHESRELFRTFENQRAIATKVAVTPDGKFIVSAYGDGTLRIWSFETGRLIRLLLGHSDCANDVAITPSSEFIVSASADRSLIIWSLVTGQIVRVLNGHTDKVNAVAITPDSKFAISASDDRTLKVWRISTGESIKQLDGHRFAVRDVAITPDGKRLISVSADYTVGVWNYTIGQLIKTLTGHREWINAVALTQDGRLAISASDDKTIKIWDLTNGSLLRTLEDQARVTDVTVLYKDQEIASASEDGIVKIWNLNTGQIARTLRGHIFDTTGVTATPDGRYLVSASVDGTLKVWDLAVEHREETSAGHLASVHDVEFLPDERSIVSASTDHSLKLWDTSTGRTFRTFRGHTDRVNRVKVIPNSGLLISASKDRTLKIWNTETENSLHTLTGHQDSVNDVALARDGLTAISISDDKFVRLWNLTKRRAIKSIALHEDLAESVICVSPNTVVFGTKEGDLKALQLSTKEIVKTVKAHNGNIRRLALAANEDIVFSASADGSVKAWNLEMNLPLRTIEDQQGAVSDVRITTDARFVIITSGFETVSARDLSNENTIALAINSAPLCCAVTSDGRLITVGDATGAVHFIDWVRFDDQ